MTAKAKSLNMISERTKNWIEAARQLSINPKAVVICPECNSGYLQVKDELIEQWNKIDRYLICDTCGQYNVLTMSMPEE
jgi:hypothetical protein